MDGLKELYRKQFHSLSTITGLPFVKKGRYMISATYIDGTPHERRDKTFAVLKDNGVYIKENGGDDLSLPEWLVLYGDCSAIHKTENVSVPQKKEEKETKQIYVDRETFFSPTIPKYYQGTLFRFLASKFGSNRTTEAFLKYGIGEYGQNGVIFWYQDLLKNICHDVRINYGTDGKRSKDSGGGRMFMVDMGYSARCLFGSHLLAGFNGEVCVVESEKTALIMSIVEKRGRVWVATGGSKKMSCVKPEYKLFGDYDSEGFAWNGIQWWDGLNVCKGWDVADWVLENM